MENMNAQQAKEMLLAVADAVMAAKPLLTEVDGKIGDGDHGIGMEKGMAKAKEKLMAFTEDANAYAPFELMGKTMLMSMGGASGVIFGSLFMAGAKGMEAPALTPQDFAGMMARSLAAIQERGKAQVGDKTMVDALAPACDAMCATAGEGFAAMLQAGAEAAAAGVEATKGMTAKFGRAKSLMERAVGHQDAGATSVWVIFEAMRQYAATH